MTTILPRPATFTGDNPNATPAEALGAAMARRGFRFPDDNAVRVFLAAEEWDTCDANVEDFRRGYTLAWGK